MADSGRIAPRLMVFSDTARAAPEHIVARWAALASAARPGSVLFTVRDYALSARARLAFGRELSALAERSQQFFGLAERADLALALRSQALHLPELGLTARDARHLLGPDVFLSRACHDPRDARAADVDALLLSPIFAERKGRAALGLSALGGFQEAAAAAAKRVALYALGAVDAGNARACLAAGADGVAVIGAALDADPRPLLEALEVCRG